MFKAKATFSSISVDDLPKAKTFYTKTLGLDVEKEDTGLRLKLPGGGVLYLYAKDDHKPATYTTFNFVVEDVDEAVDALAEQGVEFEHYDGDYKTDNKGIMRGGSNMGPDIAWFKDPAGNILSVLEHE